MNINLEISKCSSANGIHECDAEGSLGENIRMELGNCLNESGYEVCTGHWAHVRNRDGMPFYVGIYIEKRTWSGSEPNYEITIHLGRMHTSKDPMSTMKLYPKNAGVITDSLRLVGTPIGAPAWSDDIATYYIPAVLIGPKFPFPN